MGVDPCISGRVTTKGCSTEGNSSPNLLALLLFQVAVTLPHNPQRPPFARESLEVSIPCFCVVGAPVGHNRGGVSIDGHAPPLDHKSDTLGSHHDGQVFLLACGDSSDGAA